MTQAAMDNDTMVEVTQEDRELVYGLLMPAARSSLQKLALEYIRDGKSDDADAVQQVARHRHQSETGAALTRDGREALTKAIETLAASRHLIGKYCPDHHWLPEHDQRIADLRAAIAQPVEAGEDGTERFLLAYVSHDTKVIGIEHPTEAPWDDVLNAHIALRDRLNVRIAEQKKCPHGPDRKA